jgi:hypothetical protein
MVGFAVMGYHPGLEDDGVYLSAIKADLNPALYPHDADFVRLQVQATLFDNLMAGFIRVTRIPVPWAELLWQLLSLYTILWAGHSIAQKLFPERRARWAGIALLGAMFTLPVAGTALIIADQHLHPRNIATAAILLAVDRILGRKTRIAVGLLLVALVIHPIMAAFGISFCLFLMLVFSDRFPWGVGGVGKSAEAETDNESEHPSGAKALVDLEASAARLKSRPVTRPATSVHNIGAFTIAVLPGWIFEPPAAEWRRALNTRTYYFISQWRWYEWLGAIGPLVLFWMLWKYAARRGESVLERFALALVLFGAFQQAFAMIVLALPALIRITPFQPMRYLHLEYIFLVLIVGCLIGRHMLGRVVWRWMLLMLVVNGGMFLLQRLMLPASEHLELPGRESVNPWLQAFAWIRTNTPANAYFALDPEYLAAHGEDYHSFRALAERSQLADSIKDPAVVTQVPELAPRWAGQVDAQAGWSRFQIADFERLKVRFGIGWVLLSYPGPTRLTCIWHNAQLTVCRIPDVAPAPTY